MPFGLINAPSTFQHFINDSLDALGEFCGVYLDYIIVYSRCVWQYLGHFCTVLYRLQDCMLSVKHPKCDFLKSPLHFLSYMISPAGVATEPSNMSTICDIAALNDISHLLSFLGCTDFYERFVPQHATIFAPLTDLLGTHVEWCWDPP